MRRLPRAVLVGGVAAAMGGCAFGAPDPAAEQGEQVFDLWRGTVVAALVVGALVWALIIWALVRYRRRSDTVPSQNPANIPIEVFYTVVPILIVAVLFVVTMRTERDVTRTTDRPDVVVEVVGFQWQWQFTYPDEDVVVTGTSTGEGPEMVLPVGQTIRLDLRSNDVNHSFWVPQFLSKRDLIPKVDNRIDLDVTEEGEFIGRCAEFCGLDHWRMNFSVRAVPVEEYEAWLEEQRGA
jgi:cytochrome c oxidase subunit 2